MGGYLAIGRRAAPHDADVTASLCHDGVRESVEGELAGFELESLLRNK